MTETLTVLTKCDWTDQELRQPPGYQVVSVLGEGGSGTVFRAIQESTGQTVALKMLRLDTTTNEHHRNRQIERFERETQLCAELYHPHIVRLLDKGEMETGQLFATFEFVPGETLRDLLGRRGALPATEAGELMAQVLDALVCAHAQGIIHRDLKPQNIMISMTGARPHAKVLDFGIGAFSPDTRGGDGKALTLTQEILGTPSYSAPEQLRGETPTIKSDLYSWGLVLLECLTGEPVMHGKTLAEIYHKQLNPIDIPLPPEIGEHKLAPILHNVLRKDPRDRATQAAQIYTDFCQLNLANLDGTLHPSSRPTPTNVGLQLNDTLPLENVEHRYQNERRQITVLCCHLSLSIAGATEPELETLDALQQDHLSLISDVAQQYGGYIAGELGGSMMIYFGYPHVSDDDARQAASTALKLTEQTRRRNGMPEATQHTQIDLRLGMHTGTVLIRPDHPPSGLTPNIAFQLERLATPGTILASEITRQLLEPHIECEPFEDLLTVSGTTPLSVFALRGERRTETSSCLLGSQSTQPWGEREPERDVIHQQQGDAKQGTGRSTLFIGEPGSGKSRLVYEGRELVRDEGVIILACRGLPKYQHKVLYPILELLKRHLHLVNTSAVEIEQERLPTVLNSYSCLDLLSHFLGLAASRSLLLLLMTLPKVTVPWPSDQRSVSSLPSLAKAPAKVRVQQILGKSFIEDENQFIFRHASSCGADDDSLISPMQEQTHATIAQTTETCLPAVPQPSPKILADHFADAHLYPTNAANGFQALTWPLQHSLNAKTIWHTDKVLKWIHQLESDAQSSSNRPCHTIITLRGSPLTLFPMS